MRKIEVDVDKSEGLSIRSMSQRSKELEAICSLPPDEQSWRTSELLDSISVFLKDCRYVVNSGTRPSDSRKQLAPRTLKMLESYMIKWSRISVELEMSLPSRPYKRLRSIERPEYREDARIADTVLSRALFGEERKGSKGVRPRTIGIKRDFYS